MDSVSFLEFANVIYNNNSYIVSEDVDCRVGLGRCYYYLFLLSREFIGNNLTLVPRLLTKYQGLLNTKTPDIHKIIVNILSECDPNLKNMVIKLRSKRNNADYDISKVFEKKDLKKGITVAEMCATKLLRVSSKIPAACDKVLP